MRWPHAIPVLGLMALCSCGSLKAVQEFSHASSAALAAGNGVSLAKLYRDRVVSDCLRDYPFDRTPVLPERVRDACPADSLALYQRADSAIAGVYGVLGAYFTALEGLSAGELAGHAFETGTLENALQSQTLFPVQAEQVEAVRSLGQWLAATGTELYRRKKISASLAALRQDLDRCLNLLTAVNRDEVDEALTLEKLQTYNRYTTDVLHDTALTYLGKQDLARQYLQAVDHTEWRRQRIALHLQMLDDIRKGCGLIYAQRAHLTGKELASGLATYTAQLQQLQAAFRQPENQ